MVKFTLEILFIVIISVYSIIITKYIPKKFYTFSNLFIAFGAIIYGLLFGLKLSQLGLSLDLIKANLIIGLTLCLPIFIVVTISTFINKINKHYSHSLKNKYNFKSFAYELGFRIPFGTALSEEVIFRSVLLALLLNNHATGSAVVVSSILFGFWHIFPTLHSVKNHTPLIEEINNKHKRTFLAVLISVFTTSIVGVGFVLLTLKTRSFIAAWLIHSAINGSAVFGGYFLLWRKRR